MTRLLSILKVCFWRCIIPYLFVYIERHHHTLRSTEKIYYMLRLRRANIQHGMSSLIFT